MSETSANTIVFDNVSKFYGEILGVNRVTLEIRAGITSLVGPNGAGKTTLMNLLAGLLRPTRGTINVLGIPTDQPQLLFRQLGYCSQFDSFPRGLTGREFISCFLKISGFTQKQAGELAEQALARVDLLAAADRKIGAYSKGMR
ncbi:MAG TPA: ABC transporter ATP-binding protein, partial [Pyrinomonadaceae bacterium]|nr:ABC transporter ATP-binding protein [Pyrinomonadaceae bacterium]